jgi:hypothetical protein
MLGSPIDSEISTDLLKPRRHSTYGKFLHVQKIYTFLFNLVADASDTVERNLKLCFFKVHYYSTVLLHSQ